MKTTATRSRDMACSADTKNRQLLQRPASRLCDTVTRGLALKRTPRVVQCSAVTILKFLIIFELGALHFHFSLDPTNYAAGLAATLLCALGRLPETHKTRSLQRQGNTGHIWEKASSLCWLKGNNGKYIHSSIHLLTHLFI